ncbi:BQ2448_799 [Microbotryum intermedium]|uniref:BQ2448_799 protein n=1 Tax=Microbotryum intermedium TaxID=269621 RepID=A0A238FC11_9BASI|nr:BQ2448_799 [Microbotryum intermedium]
MSITGAIQPTYPSFAAAASAAASTSGSRPIPKPIAADLSSFSLPLSTSTAKMPIDPQALKQDFDAGVDKMRFANNAPTAGGDIVPGSGPASLQSSPSQAMLMNGGGRTGGMPGSMVTKDGMSGGALNTNDPSNYGAGGFGGAATSFVAGPNAAEMQQQQLGAFGPASPFFGAAILPPSQVGSFGGSPALSSNGFSSPFLGQPGQATFEGHAAPQQQNQNPRSVAQSTSPYATFGSPAHANGPTPNNGQPGFNNTGMNGYGSPSMMGMVSPMMGMTSPQLGAPFANQGGFNSAQPTSFGMMPTASNLASMNHTNLNPTPTGRTVYVGNLPSDASVDELLSLIRFGPIEAVKIIPEKSCAFISFLDQLTAAAFHSDAVLRKLRLHENDLRIGWGKPTVVPPIVAHAVQQSGATRNVYLGNLDESTTEESLRDDLSRFGPIDQVKIVRDKNIAFVHFLSIGTAIKVIQALIAEPEYAGKRVSFGKDRTAYVPRSQQQQAQHNLAAAAMGQMAANYGMYGAFGPLHFPEGVGSQTFGNDPNGVPGNRTIYLGNIHPDSTTEEICNTIRGGILQQVRYIPDKHICFITFVEPQCALAFYQHASYQGLALHNRRLKIGWGKNSGTTPPGIAMVVQSGGSRNVYVGNIEDFERFSEERLRKDFGEYGDIELVNFLREKQCCFVNFTNIANAIKAIEGIKANPEYAGLKISFGKDRCGGLPRSYPSTQSRVRHHHHHHYHTQQAPLPGVGSPSLGAGHDAFDTSSMPHSSGLMLEDGASQSVAVA